nr:T9SS type A sorting domain-containing protein [uncultured Draconibacterium sp.]
MKFRTLFILLAFVSSFVIAQTQVPNGDFESWTLYPEGISGGGDFYMPVLADGTEAGLYNAVGNGWWHENMQNVAGRFYNSQGYFYRYEESDANGYALKLYGSGPSANGFIRFRCDEVPKSLKGCYKFSNTGCDEFTIYAYAVNSADTLTLGELLSGTVHSSANSFVAPITESFQDFEINLSDFEAIDIDYFVIMFSALMNHSCTKTLPTGDVFTNDPNGYAVVDDLKLVYDTPTSVDDEFTKKDIIAFPNPTTGLINLKIREIGVDANIQLFDLIGNKLMEKSAESDVEQIDLKNFSSGVYFLHITKDMKKKTIKIVKQ